MLDSQPKPGHDPTAAATAPLPGINDRMNDGAAALHCIVTMGWDECIAPLMAGRGADIDLLTEDAEFVLGQTR